MNTTQARAAVGGEVGANGEWYEGGKFIATKDNAKRRKAAMVSTRRQEISHGIWEVPPVAGLRSVFSSAAGIVKFNHATGSFDFASTWNADELRVNFPQAFEMAARFNAGERWYS
jgi:hypothetical protein